MTRCDEEIYIFGEQEIFLIFQVLFESTGRGKSKSVELEDVKFHQCVRLSRFENDRTISFIPPDGEFELMSYRSVSMPRYNDRRFICLVG